MSGISFTVPPSEPSGERAIESTWACSGLTEGGGSSSPRDVKPSGQRQPSQHGVRGFKALVALGALGLGFRVVFLLRSMFACAIALASFARIHVAPSAVVSFREFIGFEPAGSTKQGRPQTPKKNIVESAWARVAEVTVALSSMTQAI